MIMSLYQFMCGYLAVLIIRGLFMPGKRQEKAVMAMMLVPLVLRFLLVK
jgi:hypothetical protein